MSIRKQIRNQLSAATAECFQFEISHKRDYLELEPIVLQVSCLAGRGLLKVHIAPTGQFSGFSDLRDEKRVSAKTLFGEWLARNHQSAIDLMAPLKLDPVNIPKPWGQEIWFTGIEKRGVASVQGVPLPWLLDAFSDLIQGTMNQPPVLLKILDPLANEIYGDLYFELHEEKREVYVVTHIDRSAWPDGTGRMRFGFNQKKLARYADSREFTEAYLQSVEKYEGIRRQIDRELAAIRQSAGISASEILPVELVKEWKGQLAPELIEKEKTLAEQMYSFTGMISIREGDVIQVHPLTPHSLQHGIRVVEFQTPHYERHILSFEQQVLTQDLWDTRAAMEKASFKSTSQYAGNDQTIADFEEFSVDRVKLNPADSLSLEHSSYLLIMVVKGETQISGQMLYPEEAVCVSACVDEVMIENSGKKTATLLVAAPRKPSRSGTESG